jgi:hypothetical protein
MVNAPGYGSEHKVPVRTFRKGRTSSWTMVLVVMQVGWLPPFPTQRALPGRCVRRVALLRAAIADAGPPPHPRGPHSIQRLWAQGGFASTRPNLSRKTDP